MAWEARRRSRKEGGEHGGGGGGGEGQAHLSACSLCFVIQLLAREVDRPAVLDLYETRGGHGVL